MVCWNFCQIIILSKSLIVLNPNRIFSQNLILDPFHVCRCGRNVVAARRIINFCCMPGLNSKLTEPIKKLSFGEDENTKNASSLGLFLADRTRGASKIPRVIFHVADGHLDSIFQSTARHTLLRKARVSLLDVK